MFRKITILAALAATATTMAVAAGPADAARYSDYSPEDTTVTYEPSGDTVLESPQNPFYESVDESAYCKTMLAAANAYAGAAYGNWIENNDAAAEEYEAKADQVAGTANANGCTLVQPE